MFYATPVRMALQPSYVISIKEFKRKENFFWNT